MKIINLMIKNKKVYKLQTLKDVYMVKSKFSECNGRIRIYGDGYFEVKPDNAQQCKRVLKKLNPRRGEYWKRHIPEFANEMEHSDVKKHRTED